MSTGAKVGTGIVVPLAVIAFATSIYLCYRRRRKPRVTNNTDKLVHPASPQVYGVRNLYTAAEIEGSKVPELAVHDHMVESPQSLIKPELPSGCL